MTPLATMLVPAAADLTNETLDQVSSLLGKKSDKLAKAKKNGEDFEQVFLNTMMQSMFKDVGDGPLGGKTPGADTWRSMLVEEMSKSVAKAGGIGLADHVTRELLAQQQINAKAGS